MLRIGKRVDTGQASDLLALPYDERKKSRLRARTTGGVEVAIVLPRGSQLRDGELLEAESGELIGVRAAQEEVSEARSDDALCLLRAAYHLGNRHVPLQIGMGFVRYQHDHVLDEMVRELGLSVWVGRASFEPEGGAYSGHSHSHGHKHEHD
jgi:urease accessory protein